MFPSIPKCKTLQCTILLRSILFCGLVYIILQIPRLHSLYSMESWLVHMHCILCSSKSPTTSYSCPHWSQEALGPRAWGNPKICDGNNAPENEFKQKQKGLDEDLRCARTLCCPRVSQTVSDCGSAKEHGSHRLRHEHRNAVTKQKLVQNSLFLISYSGVCWVWSSDWEKSGLSLLTSIPCPPSPPHSGFGCQGTVITKGRLQVANVDL